MENLRLTISGNYQDGPDATLAYVWWRWSGDADKDDLTRISEAEALRIIVEQQPVAIEVSVNAATSVASFETPATVMDVLR